MNHKIGFLFFILLFSLSACLSPTNLQLAEGGIGGTGISTGSITAFGSVFVNGVEYDTKQATLIRNGQTVIDEVNFQTGEYVTILGTVNSDGLTGKAVQISYNKILLGAITDIDIVNNKLIVLGQTISLDALTVLHGFKILSELKPGNVIEISGISMLPQGILATSVTKIEDNFSAQQPLEVEGKIQQLDPNLQYFRLGSLWIEYSQAELTEGAELGLQEGQWVEVESYNSPINSHFIATKVSLKKSANYANGSILSLEGVVTQLISPNEFMVNDQKIVIDAKTSFKEGNSNQIVMGKKIEVSGTLNEQHDLLAKTVEIKTNQQQDLDEIEDVVTDIDLEKQTIKIGSHLMQFNNSTVWQDESQQGIEHMNASYLQIGNYVDVQCKAISSQLCLIVKIKREDIND